MRPVFQSYWQAGDRGSDAPMGDCLRACVASIFEIDPRLMPNFMDLAVMRQQYKDRWYQVLDEWLAGYGLRPNWYYYGTDRLFAPRLWHPGYWIASVASKDPSTKDLNGDRGGHVVVVYDGKIVHDPNPRSKKDRRYKAKPYRFRGELWFEVADPVELMAVAR